MPEFVSFLYLPKLQEYIAILGLKPLGGRSIPHNLLAKLINLLCVNNKCQRHSELDHAVRYTMEAQRKHLVA